MTEIEAINHLLAAALRAPFPEQVHIQSRQAATLLRRELEAAHAQSTVQPGGPSEGGEGDDTESPRPADDNDA